MYEGRTIDTTSTAKLKIAKVNSDNTLTLAEPPPIINRSCCTDGDYLFVQSALKADNEEQRVFRKASVIDVYNLAGGAYLFSFYIPHYKSARLHAFKVFGNKLYVIADNYLLTYRFTHPLEQ